MRIIDKYFTKQLISIFVLLLLVLTSLAWMMQIMGMMKFLITYGIKLSGFLGLTVLMVPFIISIIMPFVTFIAVIFVYNKLIADNEITVMAAIGMSPGQIAAPAIKVGAFLTALSLGLNIWIVPYTQNKFYDTQWQLRYGLANMKIQESAFTPIVPGLVVYVEKVSGYDLSQVMMSDKRRIGTDMTILAEKGKMVATPRGLSMIMTNGSLQSQSSSFLVGSFESFEMDMNLADGSENAGFKARRIPTGQLLKDVLHQTDSRQHESTISELSTRFLSPFMNFILSIMCALILLKSSLLRRRASMAPFIAIAGMAAVMALFMTASSSIGTVRDLLLLAFVQIIVLLSLITALFKK